jgi:hypothetical protein
MHRKSIVVVATAAALALTPAGALAHGQAKHHARRHAKHHAKHSHRVHTHVLHFRPSTAAASGTANSTAATTPPSRGAGTVASFDGTTLVITLNDGSTATGIVTSNTQVSCPSSTQTSIGSDQSSSSGDDQGDQTSGSGDDQGDQTSGSGDSQGGQPTSGSDDQSDQSDQGDASDSGDGGDQSSTTGSCSSSDLTQGAAVDEASLKVSSAGESWLEVKLG